MYGVAFEGQMCAGRGEEGVEVEDKRVDFLALIICGGEGEGGGEVELARGYVMDEDVLGDDSE